MVATDELLCLKNAGTSDLQPLYGNGIFINVYLLALDNTKKKIKIARFHLNRAGLAVVIS